jgi:hypothetical protein
MSEHSCRPGDIVVSHIYGGWVLGRILPERGPGPWWEYLEVAPELIEAIDRARLLVSTARKGRVWFHDGNTYRPVPAVVGSGEAASQFVRTRGRSGSARLARGPG